MSVQTSPSAPEVAFAASLSPSRAADFKTCPLLYRFRAIDRIPERPTPDQVRGTLVHAVLERLFDLPSASRTKDEAAALVRPQWERLLTERSELADLFTVVDDLQPESPDAAAAAPALPSEAANATTPPEAANTSPGEAALLESATRLLDGYFAVEDPRRVEPAERECLVEAVVDDHLLLRGYIDRLDVSVDGDLRVVDYKTGGAPREAFEARALFQLKFYALVLWRTRGVVPKVLRLVYLGDREVCDYAPEPEELVRFERTLLALWRAIERSTVERDFRPRPSRLCGWCGHHSRCPAYGGTLPPFPEPVPASDVADEPVPVTDV